MNVPGLSIQKNQKEATLYILMELCDKTLDQIISEIKSD